MQKYIHYGHTHFDKNLFVEIINRTVFSKPHGGLWASPMNAEYGWKDWNDVNEFKDCDEENSFIFSLKEGANVVHIYSKEDLDKLPQTEKTIHYWYCIDFEKLKNEGVDAIELHLSEDRCENYCDRLYELLYGWDCDSILIMNPDIVVEERK